MAVAGFKHRRFKSAQELEAFVTSDSTIATIYAIIFDHNGSFVLFYK